MGKSIPGPIGDLAASSRNTLKSRTRFHKIAAMSEIKITCENCRSNIQANLKNTAQARLLINS